MTALPPHDDEAEAGALACVLVANGNAAELLAELTGDDFYDQRHRFIFDRLRALESEGKPLDPVALAQSLRDTGDVTKAGGFDYLALLPDSTPSPANFPTFLEAVRDRAARRAALRDSAELTSLASDTSLPAGAIAAAAERLLAAHAQGRRDSEKLTIRTPAEILGMTFDESDRILGDRLLASGQSLVIAGAGSIGKSRLLLQLAAATITGHPFVSLETRSENLRWLVLQAENSNRRLRADFEALQRWTGDAWPHVQERLFVHTLESDADGFLSLGDLGTQRRLAAAISETRPDVIGWDSLYNFGIGDLNSDQDMAETLLTLSRISRAGNPHRAIVVLHHALTGKAGAARAHGYERSSFGRNSKVLHSWTRGQINVAPGSPDSNDLLVLTCGKCSNGKEFPKFAVRLNPETMIYEPDAGFDFDAWEGDLASRRDNEPLMTPARVSELCRLPTGKGDLAKAIQDDCGCYRTGAYRYIQRALKARLITHNKANDTYTRK